MSLLPLTARAYILADVSATSQTITLTDADAAGAQYIRIYNGTDAAVFVTSGLTEPTAVFPASASTPVAGVVVAAGAIEVFIKPAQHKYIAAIQESTGTGDLHINVGMGI